MLLRWAESNVLFMVQMVSARRWLEAEADADAGDADAAGELASWPAGEQAAGEQGCPSCPFFLTFINQCLCQFVKLLSGLSQVFCQLLFVFDFKWHCSLVDIDWSGCHSAGCHFFGSSVTALPC